MHHHLPRNARGLRKVGVPLLQRTRRRMSRWRRRGYPLGRSLFCGWFVSCVLLITRIWQAARMKLLVRASECLLRWPSYRYGRRQLRASGRERQLSYCCHTGIFQQLKQRCKEAAKLCNANGRCFLSGFVFAFSAQGIWIIVVGVP